MTAMRISLLCALLCPLFCLTVGAVCSVSAADVDFDRDVAPLLSRRCLGCHSGDEAEGKLDLSAKEAFFAGGESGAAVIPGNASQSLLWKRIAAGEMPEDNPLPEEERKVFKDWISRGAQWGTQRIDVYAYSTDARAGYDWWSLQPLRRTVLPKIRDSAWANNAVDYFILSKLELANLTPSPEADSSKLIRRVYYDVTGLPPEPSVLGSLDGGFDSYAQLVDRLLASPRYGQKWARHWLDIVRFGESHGFEYNQPRNNSWRYRNWVIAALNHGLPYDEFVRQQIAGDILHPDDPAAWSATGFIVAGPHNTTKPSSDKMRRTMRHDELEDIVGTIGQTFLGLTINCARCHDHKFDPITQKEYYQMVATMVGIDHGERELPHEAASVARRQLTNTREQLKSTRERLKSLETEIKHAPETAGASQLDELKRRIDDLVAEEKRLAEIRGPKTYMVVPQQPPKVARLRRGDVTSQAEEVFAAGLKAINSGLADFGLGSDATDADRRAKLAEWMTANHNPLLARVIVNRLWHYHFGQGLVRTPSDFGFNGDRPSHPELLEYLANELIQNDWDLKSIHRLILTSATYRQSSLGRQDAIRVDANNRWLWRMNPRRLSAEEMRDSILCVAAKLDDRLGGPGYRDVREYKYLGSHYYDPIVPAGADALRRTVYRFSPRGAKRTILDVFDCPDPSAKAPKRQVTITPLQALSLMNHQFVLEVSDNMEVLLSRAHDTAAEQIRHLYRLAYSRHPSLDEIQAAEIFLSQTDLSSLCRVIFNSNEFLYVR